MSEFDDIKNKNIKILCLSFWTPPIVRPQSILIGKMVKEWIEQGLNPVIITYDVCGDWDIKAPIYKIPQFNKSMFTKIFSKITLIRRILWKFYYKKIFNITKNVIKKHNCNLVFSFSNPQDSNIVGAMLKEKLGIKFISHFSDPWYDNPYNAIKEEKILKSEKFVIGNSNRIIFTNNTAKELVMKKYNKDIQENARIIPHCYDIKDYPEAKGLNNKFIFSYIGAFYEQRNPELLFKAFKKNIDTDKGLLNKFKIKLIGAANDYAGYSVKNIESMLKTYDLKENTEIIPPVSYEESLRYMKLSDCLIVIDADMAGSPFLPSKVVDYAGSKNLIIGITPANSPTDQLLKSLGYKSFNYNQVDELANYLKKLIDKEITIEINQEFLKQYDVKNTTAKLMGIFEEVVN